MKRYDIYNESTGELLASDWPLSAAIQAENYGYHGVTAGNILAVERPGSESRQRCEDEWGGVVPGDEASE